MANEPVVSVGEVVWQAVAVIERTAASATGANRRINSAGLEELEAVILGLVGPHEARQYSVNLNGQLMHHGIIKYEPLPILFDCSPGKHLLALERGRHFAGDCRRAQFNPDDRQRSRLIVRGRV